MLTGSCLCGAVTFDVARPPKRTVACHCGQCRKMSGHLWAAGIVDEADLTLTQDRGLAWYASSDFAKRGFCRDCGCSLFWKHNDEAFRAVALGAFDDLGDVTLDGHIMGAHKADYYDIHDTLPVRED